MIERFGLYLVLTDPVVGYEACTEAAVAEGVRYVQLRMKDRPREQVLKVARTMRSITSGSTTRFIVNDDVGVASEVDADGVHLGQHDLPIDQARAAWPVSGKLFGLSTHDEVQEKKARGSRPDYVGVGPLHVTPTKRNPDPLLGVDRACSIIRGSPLTTVAIGGIDASNLASLLRRGVDNFAVVRAVCGSSRPREAVRRLTDIWRDALGL